MKRKVDAVLNNCLSPYICSFLNATDLIRSRSLCSSWKNIYQYATYWIQISCIASSLLTKMLSEMKELIYCDVIVVSEGQTWDLIIHPHQKLTYLRIIHIEHKIWDGGNCIIGPMPKLHTLEITDAVRVGTDLGSQFDYVTLETPQLYRLRVYNFIIPDHCVPSSITELRMTPKCKDVNLGLLPYNLGHCTKLSYLCCISSMFQNQKLDIFSTTIQFIYCNCFRTFGFSCPNLKWFCIARGMLYLPLADFLEVLTHHHPYLQKLFVEYFSTKSDSLFQEWNNNHNIKLVNVRGLAHFEMAIHNKLNELLNES